jgi:hypothetical protein
MAKKEIILNLDGNQIKMLENALKTAQFSIYAEQVKAKEENNITARKSIVAKFMSIEDILQQITDQALEELTS